MTKRTMLTGAIAAVLVAGMTMAVGAQGRRGAGGQLGLGPGPQGRPGLMQGRRGGEFLGGAGFGRGGRMGGGPFAELARLGLTDEQKEKVKAIFTQAEAERIAARAKTHEAILAVLTPEQRAKLIRK
ncbi:MAG: hypothetical protein EPO35_00120 [Acidobacteria bacterium]|nr:MAG: hypothetical protein EPO35_00120 [Acidobacteriota bacterium]